MTNKQTYIAPRIVTIRIGVEHGYAGSNLILTDQIPLNESQRAEQYNSTSKSWGTFGTNNQTFQDGDTWHF